MKSSLLMMLLKKDGSIHKLREAFFDHPLVKLILKDKNEGQLSCFNEGFLNSSGDIIFFLDSDDIYKEIYIEDALKIYERHDDCDFLLCGFERFGADKGNRVDYECDRDLGYSVISTLYRRRWLGSITSTLSSRREILERVLPIPHLSDWITAADNCLILGASIAGAKKFYLSKPLVNYRLHEHNEHYKLKSKLDHKRVNRLFALMVERLKLRQDLYTEADREFKTIPNPYYREFSLYANLIVRNKIPSTKKAKMFFSIATHFLLNGNFTSSIPEWHF